MLALDFDRWEVYQEPVRPKAPKRRKRVLQVAHETIVEQDLRRAQQRQAQIDLYHKAATATHDTTVPVAAASDAVVCQTSGASVPTCASSEESTTDTETDEVAVGAVSCHTLHVTELICAYLEPSVTGAALQYLLLGALACSSDQAIWESHATHTDCLVTLRGSAHVDMASATQRKFRRACQDLETMRRRKEGQKHKSHLSLAHWQDQVRLWQTRLAVTRERTGAHLLAYVPLEDVTLWMSVQGCNQPLEHLTLHEANFRQLLLRGLAPAFVDAWSALAHVFQTRNATVDHGIYYSSIKTARESARARATPYTDRVDAQTFTRALTQSLVLVTDPHVRVPPKWLLPLCVVCVYQHMQLTATEVVEIRQITMADLLPYVPGVRLSHLHSLHRWIIQRLGGVHHLARMPDVVADMLSLGTLSARQLKRMQAREPRRGTQVIPCTNAWSAARLPADHEKQARRRHIQANWYAFNHFLVRYAVLPFAGGITTQSDSEEDTAAVSMHWLRQLCDAIPVLQDEEVLVPRTQGVVRERLTSLLNAFWRVVRHYPEVELREHMAAVLDAGEQQQLTRLRQERVVWLRAIRDTQKQVLQAEVDRVPANMVVQVEEVLDQLELILAVCLCRSRGAPLLTSQDAARIRLFKNQVREAMHSADLALAARVRVATYLYRRLQFAWTRVKACLSEASEAFAPTEEEVEPMRLFCLEDAA